MKRFAKLRFATFNLGPRVVGSGLRDSGLKRAPGRGSACFDPGMMACSGVMLVSAVWN